ncbi:MAG TPA: hypothetical protein VGK55_10395 [Actinomycetes bacterium]|jgi:hypothetical protein
MEVAALVTWLVTALGGFYMLGTWISRGGLAPGSTSRLPRPVLFGHFVLAAIGLVVWIIYLATDSHALAWTALIVLIPVALLGLTMFARWLGVYRGTPVAAHAAVRAGAPAGGSEPAERSFPVPIVLGHGLFAVITLVLVLLTAVSE